MFSPADVISQNITDAVYVPHREAELLDVSGHAANNLVCRHGRPKQVPMVHIDDELFAIEMLTQLSHCRPDCEAWLGLGLVFRV